MSLDLTGQTALPHNSSITLTNANQWYVITFDRELDFLSLRSSSAVVFSFDPALAEDAAAVVASFPPLDTATWNEFRVAANREEGIQARTQIALATASAGAVVFTLAECAK